MASHRARSLHAGTVLSSAIGAFFLTGCAALQPPPIPSVPRFGLGQVGAGDATCSASLGRAHSALADAGAAAGDPAATAAAHAAHASAMAEYHSCLARRAGP